METTEETKHFNITYSLGPLFKCIEHDQWATYWSSLLSQYHASDDDMRDDTSHHKLSELLKIENGLQAKSQNMCEFYEKILHDDHSGVAPLLRFEASMPEMFSIEERFKLSICAICYLDFDCTKKNNNFYADKYINYFDSLRKPEHSNANNKSKQENKSDNNITEALNKSDNNTTEALNKSDNNITEALNKFKNLYTKIPDFPEETPIHDPLNTSYQQFKLYYPRELSILKIYYDKSHNSNNDLFNFKTTEDILKDKYSRIKKINNINWSSNETTIDFGPTDEESKIYKTLQQKITELRKIRKTRLKNAILDDRYKFIKTYYSENKDTFQSYNEKAFQYILEILTLNSDYTDELKKLSLESITFSDDVLIGMTDYNYELWRIIMKKIGNVISQNPSSIIIYETKIGPQLNLPEEIKSNQPLLLRILYDSYFHLQTLTNHNFDNYDFTDTFNTYNESCEPANRNRNKLLYLLLNYKYY